MKNNINLWPYGLMLTFMLFFAGIVAIIFIAVSHREYLVSDNYYEQEIGYQSQIDGIARARASGANITYDAVAARVIIGIPGAQLVRSCSGKIQFYRPSSPDLDRQYPFEPRADGTQTIDASKLAIGLWKVQVAWNTGGQDYYLDQRIVIAGK